jgi:uncharacterized membrane protein YukC
MFILKDGFQGELKREHDLQKEEERLNNNIVKLQKNANRLQRTIAVGTTIAALYYLRELFYFCY